MCQFCFKECVKNLGQALIMTSTMFIGERPGMNAQDSGEL